MNYCKLNPDESKECSACQARKRDGKMRAVCDIFDEMIDDLKICVLEEK